MNSRTNTAEVAKQQVSIVQDIWTARQNFFYKHCEWPAALYIGQEDYVNLRREADIYAFTLRDDGQTYMGMEMFRVDLDHHLKVY